MVRSGKGTQQPSVTLHVLRGNCSQHAVMRGLGALSYESFKFLKYPLSTMAFDFQRFYFIFIYVCVGARGANGGQKSMLDPLDLELLNGQL